jgi:predicted nucleotidyltransferase
MLSPAESEILAALKADLVLRFADRLGMLTLFGSRSRGAGRDDSDLDVMVGIRDLTRDERLDIIDRAADLSVLHGLVLSPLVVRVDGEGLPTDDAGGARARLLEDSVPL